jgi:biopolymer transport protein TolQ
MVLYSTLALLVFQDAPVPVAPNAVDSSALAEMVRNSGPVAFTVLVILLIASIFSWTIMFAKWSTFRKARVQSQRFLRAFRKSSRLSELAAVASPARWSPSSPRFTMSIIARPAAAACHAIPSPSSEPP